MYRLALIIGHSQHEQGAKATLPINRTEYEFNSDLTIDLFREAREAGLDCRIFSRNGKTRRELGKEVNAYGGVAIELHFNSFNGIVRGTETLYDALPPENESFAQLVQTKVCKALGREGKRDRGIKLVCFKERGWTNLDAVTIPGCLIEPSFCDNRDESKLLYRLRMEYVRALINATLEWHCIEREK